MEHEKEEAESEYEERESEWGEGDEAEANNGDEEMELLEEEYKHLQHRVWLFLLFTTLVMHLCKNIETLILVAGCVLYDFDILVNVSPVNFVSNGK